MNPQRVWWLSTRAYRRGWTPLAKLLKVVNYFAFRAILPYECEMSEPPYLFHRGLAVVVHPRTVFGRDVKISHGVTLAGSDPDSDGPAAAVRVEDGVTFGVDAKVIPRRGTTLTVGAGSLVGAGAIVTRDVPAAAKMVGPKAQPIG